MDFGMQIIKEDQLKEFVQELEHLLPHAYPVYKLAENHLLRNSFAWPGIEFVVDRFPNFTACIVRPRHSDPSYVPMRSHCVYNAVATSVTSFKALLDQPDSINWERAGLFQEIPENLEDVIKEVCRKRGTYIGPEDDTGFATTGWIFDPETVRTAVRHSSSEGITLRRPDRADMPVISKLWRYGAGTDETLQYLYHLHDHLFPMVGVYAEDELVGFTICSANMVLAAAYIKPAFRGRGLLGPLTRHIVEQMEQVGQKTCFCFICEENIPSMKATAKSGGERVDEWKVVYILYKSFNVRDNDPLLVWYNNTKGQ